MAGLDGYVEEVVSAFTANGCEACAVVSRSEWPLYREAVVRVSELLVKVGRERGLYFVEVSSIAAPPIFHTLEDIEVALGWANAPPPPGSMSSWETPSLDDLVHRVCERRLEMSAAISGEKAADTLVMINKVATERGDAFASWLRGVQ